MARLAILVVCFLSSASLADEPLPDCRAKCAADYATCRAAPRCGDKKDRNCRCRDKEATCKMTCSMPIVLKTSVGKLDPDAIAKTIRGRLGVVKTCYETGLAKNPRLAGSVKVHFDVSGDGQVTSADAEEVTLEDATVVACILDRIRAWSFPPPNGGAITFSYPFVFQSSK